jgi:hypothetical protein
LGDFSGQRKQGNHSSAEIAKLQKELSEGKMALNKSILKKGRVAMV